MLIDPNIPVRIDEILYKQIASYSVGIGDLVLDLKDGSYGFVDTKYGDIISVRDDWAVKVGVPLWRVRKLIYTIDPLSIN